MTQKPPPSRAEKELDEYAAVDPTGFRRALSSFATGVAVVTTLDATGAKVGITINSFSSVSLDPPLVLWSIAEDSMSYGVFTIAEHFAVHVLSRQQQELSSRHTGGDHKIIVGRVHRFEDRASDPLVLYRSRFLTEPEVP